MKTLDSQTSEPSRLPMRFDLSDPHTIRTTCGNFYRGMGWFDLVSSIISLLTCYWTDQLHITFSFIFFFWIGRSLKDGVPAARKWAIGIGFAIAAFSIAGFFLDGFRATVGSLTFYKGDVGFAIVVGIFSLLVMVPAIVLMGDRGRKAYSTKKEAEQAVTPNA